METKTEADSTDITEDPNDDKSRPYVCTVCDKRFTTKRGITEHRIRHTGENVYSCSQCEKRLSSRVALCQHKCQGYVPLTLDVMRVAFKVPLAFHTPL